METSNLPDSELKTLVIRLSMISVRTSTKSRKYKNGRRTEKSASTKLSAPAQQHRRFGGWSDPQPTSWREGPTKERPNNNQNPITSRDPT